MMNQRTKEVTDALDASNISYTVKQEELKNVDYGCTMIEIPMGDRLFGRIYLYDNEDKFCSFEIQYELKKDKALGFGYDEILGKKLKDNGVIYNVVFDVHPGLVSFFSEKRDNIKMYLKGIAQFKDPKVYELVKSIDNNLVYFYEKRSLEIFFYIFEDADEDIIKGHVELLKEDFTEIYGENNSILPILDKYQTRLINRLKVGTAKEELRAIIDSFNKEVEKYKED